MPKSEQQSVKRPVQMASRLLHSICKNIQIICIWYSFDESDSEPCQLHLGEGVHLQFSKSQEMGGQRERFRLRSEKLVKFTKLSVALLLELKGLIETRIFLRTQTQNSRELWLFFYTFFNQNPIFLHKEIEERTHIGFTIQESGFIFS